MKLRVIVNPQAQSGAARRKTPRIADALTRAGVPHEIAFTRGPGDAARLVREAWESGFDSVAVAGGDGTLNEAAQAYVNPDGSVREGPALGLIPLGTGGDFRRTFDLPDDPDRAVERLIHAEPHAIDLGILELTSHSGERVVRAFINIASFGIGGLTDRIVNRSPKWMGGRGAFFIGTLRAMMVYRNQPVSLTVDGKSCLEGPVLNVAIANGRYFGGGMCIAPDANPKDGLFDVIALYDLTRAQGIALASKIYRGTHVGTPGVRVARGSLIHAEPLLPRAEVLIDMDGETPGRLPLTARVAPGAIQLRL